jgi:hypothetical protein
MEKELKQGNISFLNEFGFMSSDKSKKEIPKFTD